MRQQSEAEDPMAGLQADLDRFRDLALRSQADFENYKKRSRAKRKRRSSMPTDLYWSVWSELFDNFELGLAAAKEQGPDSPIYSGMVLVQKQLNDLLAENGLQPIEAEEKTLTPTFTRQLPMNRAMKILKGIVLRQARRGYRFKDRLLRPAKVVVSSGQAK